MACYTRIINSKPCCNICIHFRGLLPPLNFARCKIHFASKSCVLLHWKRYCTVLEQWALVKPRCNKKQWQTLQRGKKNGITEILQTAPPIFGGRSSRWASAHILVANTFERRQQGHIQKPIPPKNLHMIHMVFVNNLLIINMLHYTLSEQPTGLFLQYKQLLTAKTRLNKLPPVHCKATSASC